MLSSRVKYLIWAIVAVLIAVGVSFSSYNHSQIGTYLLIAYTIIVTIVAMAGKINSRYFPLVILGISAGMVLQTTMYGTTPIGTDIQVEMYFAKDVAANGWNPSTTHLYNMSIVTIWIVPSMIKIGIDPVFIFKAILPLCLVVVPVILYLVYNKFLNHKVSFISTLFFMAMPAFSIAIPTIAKQEVAELFLALMVLLMVSKV